ncbi:hypothetical protein VTK26DRAFT_7997 [Humicola hyalothermophila]
MGRTSQLQTPGPANLSFARASPSLHCRRSIASRSPLQSKRCDLRNPWCILRIISVICALASFSHPETRLRQVSKMANKTQPAKDSAQDEEWLEGALHRLDELHLQLRRLRSALPRMLEPLQAQHTSPQAAFTAYMQSIEGTSKEIAGFREAILAVQAEGVFQKARESQTVNAKGIKQWRARDDPDWANPETKRRRIPHN